MGLEGSHYQDRAPTQLLPPAGQAMRQDVQRSESGRLHPNKVEGSAVQNSCAALPQPHTSDINGRTEGFSCASLAALLAASRRSCSRRRRPSTNASSAASSASAAAPPTAPPTMAPTLLPLLSFVLLLLPPEPWPAPGPSPTAAFVPIGAPTAAPSGSVAPPSGSGGLAGGGWAITGPHVSLSSTVRRWQVRSRSSHTTASGCRRQAAGGGKYEVAWAALSARLAVAG